MEGAPAAGAAGSTTPGAAEAGEDYFSGASSVHRLMLSDRARNDAYAAALLRHAPGRVVLDVGTGTGWLALFAAARAGARHVFAVEACAEMAAVARELARRNGLEGRVTVLAKRGEVCARAARSSSGDLRLPGADAPAKVEVLVSEWMGFYLLHESMVESVLVLRDRFLDPAEGVLLPSHCTMFCAPVAVEGPDGEEHGFYGLAGFDEVVFGQAPKRRLHEGAAFTQDPLGLSGRSLEGELFQQGQPNCVHGVRPWDLLAPGAAFKQIDLYACAAQELRQFSSGELEFQVAGSLLPLASHLGADRALWGGVAVWFDCAFRGRQGGVPDVPDVVLSTSPHARPTHWLQTVIWLGAATDEGLEPCPVRVDPGARVHVELEFEQDEENPRWYDISLSARLGAAEAAPPAAAAEPAAAGHGAR
ncbi:unnamed protein product [Prorocentrum cordatum]|uniref:Protein arginine N-methyltransferase n=1 Tax=Prorocentrum cordatum TaxID=2364126 RepID=A0ABN9PSM4_9DINO|nr:unnamed protein product [Polarella glacialis]